MDKQRVKWQRQLHKIVTRRAQTANRPHLGVIGVDGHDARLTALIRPFIHQVRLGDAHVRPCAVGVVDDEGNRPFANHRVAQIGFTGKRIEILRFGWLGGYRFGRNRRRRNGERGYRLILHLLAAGHRHDQQTSQQTEGGSFESHKIKSFRNVFCVK